MKNAFYEACRDITDTEYISFDKQNECPLHFHGQAVFFIVERGEYSVTVKGKTETLKKDEVAFCDSFDDYAISALTEDALSSLVTVPNRHLKAFEAHKNGRCFADNFIKDRSATRLFRDLMEIMRACGTNNSYLLSGLYASLLGLCEEIVPLEERKDSENRDFMRKVLFFLQQHMTENITLTFVATSVGYSKNYFSNLFQRCFNTDFRIFLRRMRLNYADYLINQGMPVLSAALNSGFQSLATFYRGYRQEFGNTPSQSGQ